MTKKLPQTLNELITTYNLAYPIESWSGAVNIVIVENHIAFIRRSDEMPSHKGQIGFFGGHKESEESPVITAVRETEEESFIKRECLEVIGMIEPVYTNKMQLIIPVVTRYNGNISEFLNQAISNGEWSDLILAPIEELKNISRWQHAQIVIEEKRSVYFLPLDTLGCHYHPENSNTEFVLWGASAKMIWNFFKI